MSEKKNKKNVIAEALLDVENITSTLKEESKSIISGLLKESVKDALRESIEDDEEDYEIQGGDEDSSTEDSGEESTPETEDAEVDSDDTDFSFDDKSDDASDDADAETEDGTDVPESNEEGDEWSDFDQYKVDDNTYDLTGENDYDSVVKVYKRLKDEDNVIVKKDGNKVSIEDKQADTEYVIDLGGDEVSDSDEGFGLEINEDTDIAGLNENKNRKTMKESKEQVFEVDLGYTDNYQSKDPIQGLSNNEPSKYKTLDKGVPTGTEKPWAKDAKSKSAPYGEKTLEEGDVDLNPIMAGGEQDSDLGTDEANLEEGGARTTVKKSHKVKSASNEGNPQVGPVRTPNSDNAKLNEGKKSNKALVEAIEAKYKTIIENLLKKTEAVINENKQLKNDVLKIKGILQENLLVTNSLGSINRLFMENTTTYKEKVDIINRFNGVKSIDETKALYETINRELKKGVKQTLPLQESSMTVNGSAINETKVYESQDLLDMKNFMKRMANC